MQPLLPAAPFPAMGADLPRQVDPTPEPEAPGTLPPVTPEPEPESGAGLEMLLSTRKTILTPNSATQLTVSVFAGEEGLAVGSQLELALPDTWLEPTGNQTTNWDVPALGPGETYQTKVVVQATGDRERLPAATLVQARLTMPDATVREQELYLGIIPHRGGQPEPAPSRRHTPGSQAATC